MEIFAVDLDRPAYKPSVAIHVLSDVFWFDDGHKRAFKDEYIKVEPMDAQIALKHGTAELVEKPATAPVAPKVN